MSTCVDLKNCDLEIMTSEDKVRQFVDELVTLIDMKKYGDCNIVTFGNCPRLYGFSMTQLIETSLISAHFADDPRSIYIDIFSCKDYPPYKAAEFCKKFFKAKTVKVKVNFRY